MNAVKNLTFLQKKIKSEFLFSTSARKSRLIFECCKNAKTPIISSHQIPKISRRKLARCAEKFSTLVARSNKPFHFGEIKGNKLERFYKGKLKPAYWWNNLCTQCEGRLKTTLDLTEYFFHLKKHASLLIKNTNCKQNGLKHRPSWKKWKLKTALGPGIDWRLQNPGTRFTVPHFIQNPLF